jgi:predicted DNA-binding transcriptional regulator AlpA
MQMAQEQARMSDAPEALLTPRDAAQALGLSVRTVERYRADGSGPPFVKLSPGQAGRVRYRRADLESWIANRCVACTATAA